MINIFTVVIDMLYMTYSPAVGCKPRNYRNIGVDSKMVMHGGDASQSMRLKLVMSNLRPTDLSESTQRII